MALVTNLVTDDFFAVIYSSNENKSTIVKDDFDVVIGNPPFESKLSQDGLKVNQEAQQQNKQRGMLPDKQSAYLFFEQALNILAQGGRVCIIQPSGLLYNRKAEKFPTALF